MTTTENNCKFCLLIHGGAGVISKELDPTPYHTVLQRILIASYNFGKSEKCLSALDLAEFAVKELENEPLFNAGKGAVYTNSGTHELEASIMDGQTLKCGTVSMITKMKNPVSVARLVMERTDHISIIGETAEKIGIEAGLEVVDQTYYDTPHRYQQLVAAKQSAGVYNDHDLLTFRDRTNKNSSGEGATGTVGCVCAFDGNVACATSTGGMTNKLPGRQGDTPVIGSGSYANNKTCAVSGTGRGEDFLRSVAAYDIHARIFLGKKTLEEAVKETVFETLPAEAGGFIAIDKDGNTSMTFNSKGMFRGMCNSEGHGSYGVWEYESPFTISKI